MLALGDLVGHPVAERDASPHPVGIRREPHGADHRRHGADARQHPSLRRGDPRVRLGRELHPEVLVHPSAHRGASAVGEEPVIGAVGHRPPGGDPVASRAVLGLDHDRKAIEDRDLERPARPDGVGAHDRLDDRPLRGWRQEASGHRHRQRVREHGAGARPQRAAANHAYITVPTHVRRQVGGVAVERADRLRDFLEAGLGHQRDHRAVGKDHPEGRALARASGERDVLIGRPPHASPRRERGRVEPQPGRARRGPTRSADVVVQLGGVRRRARDDVEAHEAVGWQRDPGEPGAVGPDLHGVGVDRERGVAGSDRAEEKARILRAHERVGRRIHDPNAQRTTHPGHGRQRARRGRRVPARSGRPHVQSGGRGGWGARAGAGGQSGQQDQRAASPTGNHGCKVSSDYHLRHADVDAPSASP